MRITDYVYQNFKDPTTDWFDTSINPEREGVYEVECIYGSRCFAYWHPEKGWFQDAYTPECAFGFTINYADEGEEPDYESLGGVTHHKKWRGLTKETAWVE